MAFTFISRMMMMMSYKKFKIFWDFWLSLKLKWYI